MQIRDRIIDFRRVRASELLPHPANWRQHGKAQRAALSGILAEVGIADAVLARQLPTGQLQIIDGHLRSDILADVEVPVLVLDVDEAEAKKLLLSIDPIAAMAGADADQLESLLSDVSFSSDALQKLIAELAKDAGLNQLAPLEEDEVPEVPEVPKSQRGDLWNLGNHRLLCGDSTSAEDVRRLLGGDQPFIMVTDPPYGVAYSPKWREEHDGSKNHRLGLVTNDHRADWTDAYRLFTGDVAYVWHAGVNASIVAANLDAAEFRIRAQIIWKKQHFVFSRGAYHWGHEPCWYSVREGRSARWVGDRTQSTVWEIQNHNPHGGKQDDADTIHSAQKPVECMGRPIANHGAAGDIVYDPFLGSGTTLIAAEKLGRHCLALEIEPAYVDVAVRRWQKLTGKFATNQTRPEVRIEA